VVSRAYERTSLIVTTNLPFESWPEVLGSERRTGALLDRLTHPVHILEANGESYRLRDARKRLKQHSTRKHPEDCNKRRLTPEPKGEIAITGASLFGRASHATREEYEYTAFKEETFSPEQRKQPIDRKPDTLTSDTDYYSRTALDLIEITPEHSAQRPSEKVLELTEQLQERTDHAYYTLIRENMKTNQVRK
jgi:hypothetical protein